MIIQIYEIEKDYFNDYVLMYPVSNGENATIKDWQKLYGYAITVKKTDLFDVMKDMDNWCCDNYSECCHFEFD